MKPDWDQLGMEYEGSSSVVIADVDCTVESDLCQKHEVRGYPTIMYYNGETGRAGEKYNGGRDIDALRTFVQDNLAKKCDPSDLETCDEKEQKFIAKMNEKTADERAAELARLDGMKEGKMKPAAKAWLNTRLAILKQM